MPPWEENHSASFKKTQCFQSSVTTHPLTMMSQSSPIWPCQRLFYCFFLFFCLQQKLHVQHGGSFKLNISICEFAGQGSPRPLCCPIALHPLWCGSACVSSLCTLLSHEKRTLTLTEMPSHASDREEKWCRRSPCPQSPFDQQQKLKKTHTQKNRSVYHAAGTHTGCRGVTQRGGRVLTGSDSDKIIITVMMKIMQAGYFGFQKKKS